MEIYRSMGTLAAKTAAAFSRDLLYPRRDDAGDDAGISDYNFKSQRRRITHQNTYFNERFGRSDFEEIEGRSVGGVVAYIMKYIEKSGEKLLYSRGLPQFFISDIMEEDVVCPYGEEEQKLLLYDDFSCWGEGEYIGRVCDDVIGRLPKAN